MHDLNIRPQGRPPVLESPAAVPLIIPGDPVNTNPDRDTLRQRIAEVLWPLTDWDGDQLNAERAADAVLAVLPDPTDRAAVLDEGADALENDSWSRRDRWGRYEREDFEAGVCHGATLLRRLAAEALTTTKPETEEPASTCTCGDAGDAFVPLGHYRDCPDAAGVRQDGAQPQEDHRG